MVLARPLSRRRFYVSVGAAVKIAVAVILALLLVGQVLSIYLLGVDDEIDMFMVPLVWVVGLMMWAFAAFSSLPA